MNKSLIRTIPLFSDLPQGEIEILAAELVERTYPVGTILFREGDPGECFYILLAGVVEIVKAMDTPNERVLAHRSAGEFIGEMGLLNRDGLRTASGRVEEEVELWEMTHQDFEALLHRVPALAYEMLRVLSTRLRDANDITIHDLMEKNLQLEKAYASLQAAQQQIIEKEILERELMQAREIQESMLPQTLPQLEGYEIGARMVPARMVGGDFYDVIPLGKDELGCVVGDVSGKGVPAALFMALTRSLLRAEAHPGDSPGEVLQRVNRHLLDMNARGLFVTVLYGILRKTTGEFAFARAGHEPLVWLDAAGGIYVTPIKVSHVLGLFAEPALETQALTVPAGGVLLLYTDGVTEARNPQGGFFELDNFLAVLPGISMCTAQEICDEVVDILADFHGTAAQADDITLVAIKSCG
jgi:sigma-B regulation protein RsbU (phosphoserine phosphatase)